MVFFIEPAEAAVETMFLVIPLATKLKMIYDPVDDHKLILLWKFMERIPKKINKKIKFHKLQVNQLKHIHSSKKKIVCIQTNNHRDKI